MTKMIKLSASVLLLICVSIQFTQGVRVSQPGQVSRVKGKDSLFLSFYHKSIVFKTKMKDM